MKKLKESNGITLIALVITIIVLLILAGITITSLSGENGLLYRASDSRDETSEVQGKELIAMQAMASLNGHGTFDYDLLNRNLQRIPGLMFNNRPIGPGNYISYDENKPIIVYYNGFFYIIFYDGRVEPNKRYSEDVKRKLKLNLSAENDDEKSPYVRYNGELYKVLYDVDSTYGWIEIVSINPIKTVTLGYNDPEMPSNEELIKQGYGTDNFEKSRWSFNNAIVTLNKHAQEYLTNVADRARCVCSDPYDPLSESTETFLAMNPSNHKPYEYMIEFGWDNKFKKSDKNQGWNENYSNYVEPVKDHVLLYYIGIRNFTDRTVSTHYWYASRLSMGGNAGSAFVIKGWRYDGNGGYNGTMKSLCYVNSKGESRCDSPTYGFRPVIRLKSKVKIKKWGNGTKEHPYELYI